MIRANGFNPGRVKSLKEGMEFTLGGKIRAAAIFDRDFRCTEEGVHIKRDCGQFCDYVAVHERKEIENFLLVPAAIDRAASRKVDDKNKRNGTAIVYSNCAAELLDAYAAERKTYVTAQCSEKMCAFERTNSPKLDNATISELALSDFEALWQDRELKLAMLPGKEALSSINHHLQTEFGVSITPTAIIDAMKIEEIPQEMNSLVQALADFVRLEPST